jgi:hypothetical protein
MSGVQDSPSQSQRALGRYYGQDVPQPMLTGSAEGRRSALGPRRKNLATVDPLRNCVTWQVNREHAACFGHVPNAENAVIRLNASSRDG